MSTLVVQIPARQRLRARGTDAARANGPEGIEYRYALTPDGISLGSHGQCAASLLPKAVSVVAVLADADVSWHRIPLPKAPASRLASALVGVLEESLLEDADGMHLALAPQAIAGEPTWVAATHRAWLTAELAALEQAQVFVDRVVPAAWPDEPASGHFFESDDERPQGPGGEGLTLSWAHPDGVAVVSLQGSLARALLPTPLPANAHWSASPTAAAFAEHWLGTSITVMSPAQRMLLAARSLWNLRQFGLAPKNRGSRALRDIGRQFLKPNWRPLRWGLVALVGVQLLGVNLWAAQQRSALVAKKKAMTTLLQTAHPQVRSVLDAPVQMQRETDALRSTAGEPGETDLEPLLQTAASAWPADRPPVDNIKYEPPGRLIVAAPGWSPEQISQFREQLRPGGWQVDASEGRITLSRAATTASSKPAQR
jgi:general secretion pathway protein L